MSFFLHSRLPIHTKATFKPPNCPYRNPIKTDLKSKYLPIQLPYTNPHLYSPQYIPILNIPSPAIFLQTNHFHSVIHSPIPSNNDPNPLHISLNPTNYRYNTQNPPSKTNEKSRSVWNNFSLYSRHSQTSLPKCPKLNSPKIQSLLSLPKSFPILNKCLIWFSVSQLAICSNLSSPINEVSGPLSELWLTLSIIWESNCGPKSRGFSELRLKICSTQVPFLEIKVCQIIILIYSFSRLYFALFESKSQ